MNEAVKKFGSDYASLLYEQRFGDVITDRAEIEVALAYASKLWSRGARNAATLIYGSLPVDKLPQKILSEGLGNDLIVELADRFSMDEQMIERIWGLFTRTPLEKIGRRARVVSLFALARRCYERGYQNLEPIMRLAEVVSEDPKIGKDLWENILKKGNTPYLVAGCYVSADPVRYSEEALKWMRIGSSGNGEVLEDVNFTTKVGSKIALSGEKLIRSVEVWKRRKQAMIAAPWVAFFASSLTLVIGLVFGSSFFHAHARIPMTFWFVAAGVFFLFWKMYPKWHSENSSN